MRDFKIIIVSLVFSLMSFSEAFSSRVYRRIQSPNRFLEGDLLPIFDEYNIKHSLLCRLHSGQKISKIQMMNIDSYSVSTITSSLLVSDEVIAIIYI